ncbi:MAG: hypothetical protein REH83_02080 [Rickettsiella sp.]|nr:hypothetical protein [Rickettsiella sp.]
MDKIMKYSRLVAKINNYLADNFAGVSTSTDIFEHTLLHFLGYNYVPEKCQFGPGEDDDSFFIYLRPPYGISSEQFRHDLESINHPIVIEPIEPNIGAGNFVVRLTVPYGLIEQNDYSQLLSSMQYLLDNAERYEFYKYWDRFIREVQNAALTITFIENKINLILLDYPYVSSAEVWNAIVTNANRSEKKLKTLNRRVAIDIQNWPMINFCCEDDLGERMVSFSRSVIVKLITNPTNLQDFLTSYSQHEFILPHNIQAFVKKHLGHSFTRKEDNTYHINFYYFEKKELLKKFGIKEIRSYQTDTRTHYYVFDKDNYIKTLLAIKEIEGDKCLEERWHSLKYYCDKGDWFNLEKQLNFFLNFESYTGLKIDYSELVFRLFEFGKEKIATAELAQIIYDALLLLGENNVNCTREVKEKAYRILFEMTLMHLNTLEMELNLNEAEVEEKEKLKAKLFEYAQKAGLSEANNYLTELCGKPLSEFHAFNNDVVTAPVETISEMAAEIKRLTEENARLKKVLGIQTENFDQVDSCQIIKLDTSSANSSLLKQQLEELKKENKTLKQQELQLKYKYYGLFRTTSQAMGESSQTTKNSLSFRSNR